MTRRTHSLLLALVAAFGLLVAGLAALGAHTNVAPGPDRFLAPDIEGAWQAVAQRAVVAAAETVTGPLA